MFLGAWKTNNYKWFEIKTYWRRREWWGLKIVVNQLSMQLWCSWSTSSVRQCFPSSSIMPHKSEWLMHVGSVDRHGKSSSILGSKGLSLSDVVHESSISSTTWQGKSVEVCRSSCGCGSCCSGSSIAFEEVERFLTAVKICSSREEEILVAARIQESSSKLLIIFEFRQLVGCVLSTHGNGVLTSPQKWCIFKTQNLN